MSALYSVGTWDTDLQAFTEQAGLGIRSFNVRLRTLRRIIRRLRDIGYTAHRRGNVNDGHEDNDPSVLIERTDGKPKKEILGEWKR